MCFAGDNWLTARASVLLIGALSAMLLAAGCPRGKGGDDDGGGPASKPPPPVRMMVVGDDDLAAAIEREWKASGRGEFELQVIRPGNLANVARLPADVIIYPSGMVGELRQRSLIAPMPAWTADSDQLNRADILPLIRKVETTWGHELVAVPFGSPQFAVLYRKDILKKLKQEPPATWQQFDKLAVIIGDSKQITDLRDVNSPAWQPVAQPLAKGWAGQVFLARAAPYVRHPDHYSALFDYQTMAPLIDDEPFVRALEEMVRTAAPASLEDTPATVRRKLLHGECVLAITWPTRTVDWPHGEKAMDVPLGCTELPGTIDVYNFAKSRWETREEAQRVPLLAVSGYMGSISASARHTRSAADALVWLTSTETGQNISAASGACSPYRTSQLSSAASWVSRDFGSDVAADYADALQAANARSLWLCSPHPRPRRIPGRPRRSRPHRRNGRETPATRPGRRGGPVAANHREIRRRKAAQSVYAQLGARAVANAALSGLFACGIIRTIR